MFIKIFLINFIFWMNWNWKIENKAKQTTSKLWQNKGNLHRILNNGCAITHDHNLLRTYSWIPLFKSVRTEYRCTQRSIFCIRLCIHILNYSHKKEEQKWEMTKECYGNICYPLFANVNLIWNSSSNLNLLFNQFLQNFNVFFIQIFFLSSANYFIFF